MAFIQTSETGFPLYYVSPKEVIPRQLRSLLSQIFQPESCKAAVNDYANGEMCGFSPDNQTEHQLIIAWFLKWKIHLIEIDETDLSRMVLARLETQFQKLTEASENTPVTLPTVVPITQK